MHLLKLVQGRALSQACQVSINERDFNRGLYGASLLFCAPCASNIYRRCIARSQWILPRRRPASIQSITSLTPSRNSSSWQRPLSRETLRADHNSEDVSYHYPRNTRTIKNVTDESSRTPSSRSYERPNQEQLLAKATGICARLKVRFKWFSIRSSRPFNADDISAFFSWILLGHVIWIIVGTTTFFSLAIFAVNTVSAQKTLASMIGDYLTQSSGIVVVFEAAIVPKWRNGVICFKNVLVSRRMESDSVPAKPKSWSAFTKIKENSDGGRKSHDAQSRSDDKIASECTQFDLTLETVEVTLSFRKWFNGKGLLKDVKIKGVRGIVDRTGIWVGEEQSHDAVKNSRKSAGFELDSFKIEDLLVIVHQPSGFRPFPVSIFNCDLPRLRRRWIFYDFMCASSMSGSIDNSLFSLHPQQSHGRISHPFAQNMHYHEQPLNWEKRSRLQINGLAIDHLNRNMTGPFSWVRRGTVDVDADIVFPAESSENILEIMTKFYERMGASISADRDPASYLNGRSSIDHDHLRLESSMNSRLNKSQQSVYLNLKLHLNDIQAVVPILTNDLSYINNALIRPIVAFMNARKTSIPINCGLIKAMDELDGCWTIFDCNLMTELSMEVN